MKTAFKKFIARVKKLCKQGGNFACEDLVRGIKTPEGLDRRHFGSWIRALSKQGVIECAGYRLSTNKRHNRAIKRLWKAGPNFNLKPMV